MNGISLAALLGAAGWFGSKILDSDETEDEAGDRVEAAPPAEPAPEIDTSDNEFLWPSGPMFQ
jgi:hypothetical protein